MAVGVRRARVDLTVDPRKMDPGLRQARSKLGNFARDGEKSLSKLRMRPPGGGGSNVFAFGGGIPGMGMLGDAKDEAMEFEKRIARLAIAQGKSNDEMEEFRRETMRISEATGVARLSIMQGVGAYQALTGDTKGATAAAETFARVAQATGAPVEDVATAAASLRQNLKIDASQFEDMFSILSTQGKAGAVELNDFAREIAEVSAQWKKFGGGTGMAGATQMGAAFQVIRKDAGTSSKAATNFMALMTALVRNSGKLKGKGIRVFDKKGQLREFDDIVADIKKKGLKLDKLTDLMGSAEAMRALGALTSNMGEFQELMKATDTKSIGRDMEQYLESPAGKIEKAWNRVKLALAEAFTPERIVMAANAMEDLAGIVGGLVDMLSDLGALWAKLSGKETTIVGQELLDKKDQRDGKASLRPSVSGFDAGKGFSIGETARSFEQHGVRVRDKEAKAAADAARAEAQRFTPLGVATTGALSQRLEADLRNLIVTLQMNKALEVKVDGNTIAKANAGASDQRRHP